MRLFNDLMLKLLGGPDDLLSGSRSRALRELMQKPVDMQPPERPEALEVETAS
jgi:hypothetical protein